MAFHWWADSGRISGAGSAYVTVPVNNNFSVMSRLGWICSKHQKIMLILSKRQIKVSHFFNTGGGIALYPTIYNNDTHCGLRQTVDSHCAVRMTDFATPTNYCKSDFAKNNFSTTWHALRVASDSYSAVPMTRFPKNSIWKFAASKSSKQKALKGCDF